MRPGFKSQFSSQWAVICGYFIDENLIRKFSDALNGLGCNMSQQVHFYFWLSTQKLFCYKVCCANFMSQQQQMLDLKYRFGRKQNQVRFKFYIQTISKLYLKIVLLEYFLKLTVLQIALSIHYFNVKGGGKTLKTDTQIKQAYLRSTHK